MPSPLPWLLLVVAIALPLAGATAPTPGCHPPERAAPDSEAAAALERGNALADRGDHAEALRAFALSRLLAREDGDPSLALLAEASAARSEAALGRTEDLPETLEALLETAAELESPDLRARVRLHLARTLGETGDDPRAATTLVQASEDARSVQDWRLHSYALGRLATLYESGGRTDEALSLSRRALSSAQRVQAPDAVYRWQWQIGRIQRRRGDDDAALAAYRRAVATLRDARDVDSRDVLPLYEGLVELLLARAGTEDTQALLAEARNALEDLKASELRDYFRDACLDAQRKASPDTVPGTLVVYPIPLEERLVLIASLGGVLRHFEVPVAREDFVAEVRAFRRTLEERTTRRYRRHAATLHGWLIDPLEPTLESGEVQTLVFVPRGALHTIPLAALRDPESGRFLIERIPLAVTPGLTLTEPRAIDRARVQLLAAGVSQPVQGFAGLGFVEDEVEAVARIFPGGRRLLNEGFEADTLEQAVSQQPFDIVHVASHGEFTADVSESYLLTFRDRISMGELSRLVGTTRFRERSLELLTLSACETAAGDDRAALGLAGVALNAGARSALATLWAVNDEVAAQLVVTFYEQLSDPSLTRAQALQRAQLATLRDRAHRHPAYWAPFLLISSWL